MLVALSFLCGFALAEPLSVTVEGAIFCGTAGESISFVTDFSPDWITDPAADVYDPDLARFTAVLSTDIYYREKDLPKGTQNRVLFEGEDPEQYDWTALLKKIGFTDAEYTESFRIRTPETDPNDSVTLLMAWQNISDLYDAYIFVIRGSFSIQEWLSAFDPGAGSESYTALTGEHPEWTDPDRCKGFDVARGRAMEMIDAFMAAHGSPDREDRILVTGHSRGGSIANLIGAELEDRSDVVSRTYTFNAAGVTVDPSAGQYTTVFNLFDSNDFFADVFPFADEGFVRYGKDLTLPILESEEVLDALTEMKGENSFISLNAEQKSAYAELFCALFPDRNSICNTRTLTMTLSGQEEAGIALADREKWIGSAEGLGLEDLCRVSLSDPDDTGKYTLTTEYSGLALLAGYAKTMAYGPAAYDVFSSLFAGDGQAVAIADFLINNLEAINCSHRLINAYILTDHVN